MRNTSKRTLIIFKSQRSNQTYQVLQSDQTNLGVLELAFEILLIYTGMIRQFSMTVQKTDNSIVRRDDCLSRHTLPTNVLDSVISTLCHSHPSYIFPPERIYCVTAILFTALFDLSHSRTHCYDKHNDVVCRIISRYKQEVKGRN